MLTIAFTRSKVYKTRLKRWGVVKNVRLSNYNHTQDDLALLRQLQKQREEWRDYEGVCKVGDRVVEVDRLIRHLLRRTQPSYGRAGKRLHIPRPANFKAPASLHASETVIILIRDYIRGRYEDSINTLDDVDRLREVQPEKDATDNFTIFTGQLQSAFEGGNFTKVLIEMRRAPAELTALMRPEPSAIVSVLSWFLILVLRFARSNHPELRQLLPAVRALVRYAASYAASTDGLSMPISHPLIAILSGFLAVEEDKMRSLALRAFGANHASFAQLLGSQAWSVCTTNDWMIMTLGAYAMDEMPVTFGKIENAVERFKDKHASHPEKDRAVSYMSWTLGGQGQGQESASTTLESDDSRDNGSYD